MIITIMVTVVTVVVVTVVVVIILIMIVMMRIMLRESLESTCVCVGAVLLFMILAEIAATEASDRIL